MATKNQSEKKQINASMANPTFESVSILKDEIDARSNARKRENIQEILQVLYKMHREGARTFSISKVGAACEAADVMKTQSIRNIGGEDYRALIEAFSYAVGGSTAHTVSGNSTPLEQAINDISSLDVRTRLNMILAENRRQRDEISRLKHAFSLLSVSSSTIRQPAGNVQVLQYPKIQVIDPLKKFISDDWMEERGWTIETNGSIWNKEENLMVAPVGFVSTLVEILDTLSNTTP